MFFRTKKSGSREYLQIVENRWENGKSRQRVISTLGRLDKLQDSGHLEALLRSGARFCKSLMVITAHRNGEATEVSTRKIGPGIIFERLWEETGCMVEIKSHLTDRRFGFDVERGIFLTVLHRLFAPGSDRSCQKWKEGYRIRELEDLEIHQIYRAMAWLGEELSEEDQDTATPFSPRCMKDRIEEGLFMRRRDLFTSPDLIFFDTTSIYFEGEGGETLGQRGHSKDRRPDCKQMVVGAVIDSEGHPICCEMWPGNTADVKTLVPIAESLEKRFGIKRICIVADRGMISRETLDKLEERKWGYILGARMRKQKEVREEVLSRAGRYQEVRPKGTNKKDPSPLKVKEVRVDDRRYVICFNEDQAKKDAADRETILSAIEEQLKKGPKSFVGNKGYRKFLKPIGKGFTVDTDKAKKEARFDGKWVLRTNMKDMSSKDLGLKYKQLWMVEHLFRSMKSLLETRPVFHKCDETIRGHVFCSFLALILMTELQERLHQKGYNLEWADVIRDLDRLEEIEIEQDGKKFLLRSETVRTCGKVFQAAGVAVPPTIRQIEQ